MCLGRLPEPIGKAQSWCYSQRMNARQWLIETHAHMPPEQALDHLDPADAERRLPGAAHSIADIVAHMSFWQAWFCLRCAGVAAPMAAPAARGWPEVTPGSWPAVRTRFVEGLARAVSLGDRADE